MGRPFHAVPLAITDRCGSGDARPIDLDDPIGELATGIFCGRSRALRARSGLRLRGCASGPTLEKLDASEFASRLGRVSRDAPGVLVLAYQSYVRGYLPHDVRRAQREAMHDWLASLPPGRAMWIELEAAKSDPGAAMTVHFSRDEGAVVSSELAKTEHHPTVVSPNAEVVSILEDTLGR
jgi:hypothetical protein